MRASSLGARPTSRLSKRQRTGRCARRTRSTMPPYPRWTASARARTPSSTPPPCARGARATPIRRPSKSHRRRRRSAHSTARAASLNPAPLSVLARALSIEPAQALHPSLHGIDRAAVVVADDEVLRAACLGFVAGPVEIALAHAEVSAHVFGRVDHVLGDLAHHSSPRLGCRTENT